MTNNQLAENSVTQLLNNVKLARDNAERDDNRVYHSFYYALARALEELQERRKAAMDSEPVYQCEFCHADASGELQWHWEDVNEAFYEQYDSERRGQRRILYSAPQSGPVVGSEPAAEVLSSRPGNDTSTIDRALPVGTPLYRHAQPAPETEREPIAWLNDAYLARGVVDGEAGSEDAGPGYIPVYREASPAQPAPVVPDESYQQLSELYHAQEKRLFKIAQRIKGPAFDKYSHLPSQAIDVLEVAIFGDEGACRAAMLQTKPDCTCPSGDGSLRWPCPSHPGNSPVIPDGLIAAVNRLLDSDGSRGCYSAIQCGDAHDEIERLLAAAPQPQNEQQNIPEIIPGWIPVSEQPPRIGARVLISDIERSGVYEALRFDGNRFNHFGCEIIANYWMPLPAAPKQENI
jgi:hypothetical protein